MVLCLTMKILDSANKKIQSRWESCKYVSRNAMWAKSQLNTFSECYIKLYRKKLFKEIRVWFHTHVCSEKSTCMSTCMNICCF